MKTYLIRYSLYNCWHCIVIIGVIQFVDKCNVRLNCYEILKDYTTFIQAEFFGLTTSEHVWLLPSYYATRWWQLEAAELDALRDSERCSNQNMMEILESTLFLGATKFSLLNEVITIFIQTVLVILVVLLMSCVHIW